MSSLTEIQTRSELEQLANELAILQEIAIDLSSGLKLPEVLQKTINYAVRLTDADSGLISFYEKNILGEFHCFNLPPGYPPASRLKDSPLLEEVSTARKPQIIEDYQQDPRVNATLKKLGLQSMVVVPILSGSRFLGFLELMQFGSNKRFSRQDLRVLEILTRHAAIAMENAEYLGKIQDEASFRRVVSDFSADINSSLDLHAVLQKLCQRTVELFELDGTYIWLLDKEKKKLIAGAAHGFRAKEFLKLSIPLSSPLAGAKVARSRKTLVANNFENKRIKTFLDPVKPKSAMFVPLLFEEKVFGVAVLLDLEDPERFDVNLVAKIETLAGQTVTAIRNAQLYEAEANRSKQLQMLQRLSLRISKERESAKITRLLCESARKLLNAQVATAALFVDEKWQWPHFSRAKDYPYDCGIVRNQGKFPLYGRPFSEMMETKKPIRMVDVSKHPLSKGLPEGHVPLKGLLGAPLLDSRGKFTGQVMVSDKHDGGYFTEDDENLLVTLVSQAGITLEKAKAYQSEHRVAMVLQESLLTEPSAHPELEVSLLYQAATEVGKVGGDFYDFFDIEDDLTAVVVGDIAGKGIQAATLTAMAKNFIRAYALEDCRPASVLSRANRALYSQVKSPDFISLIYGLLDRERGVFAYANAGHPWPMVLASRGDNVRISSGVNLPLGIEPGERYREHFLKFKAGDRLVLYTDGVIEIRRRGRVWGEDGLQRALLKYGKLSCNELSARILNGMIEYSGGRLADDIILLILRWIPRQG